MGCIPFVDDFRSLASVRRDECFRGRDNPENCGVFLWLLLWDFQFWLLRDRDFELPELLKFHLFGDKDLHDDRYTF